MSLRDQLRDRLQRLLRLAHSVEEARLGDCLDKVGDLEQAFGPEERDDTCDVCGKEFELGWDLSQTVDEDVAERTLSALRDEGQSHVCPTCFYGKAMELRKGI